ncbi:MAG: nucleotidyltransferase domain-containing protein [bacterium]|nr:nucleotidyltransferase domain-containing protein [bacterium]
MSSEILATLTYHDILNCPLTAWEVFRLQIADERHFVINDYAATLEELERLKTEGSIGEKNGFYFLKGRESLYEERIERTKTAEEKWHEVLWVLKLFPSAPFVRSAFLSGSVATGNATKGSDVDVMVVAEKGRIWTARLFLSLLVLSCGKLRATRLSKKTSGKICLNHYVTTISLGLKARGLYNAATYVRIIPIFNPEMLKKFYDANRWIFRFFPNASAEKLHQKTFPENPFFLRLRWLVEAPLRGRFGDLVERGLSYVQKIFIQKNPLTQSRIGRIVAEDEELAFHPDSPEREILDKFTGKMLQ